MTTYPYIFLYLIKILFYIPTTFLFILNLFLLKKTTKHEIKFLVGRYFMKNFYFYSLPIMKNIPHLIIFIALVNVVLSV